MTSQTAITLYGNVGGDPETRTIPGKQVTKQFYDPIIDDMVEREFTTPEREVRTFSIAVSKKDDEGKDVTRWIRCDDWNRLSRLVGKGDRVKVEGESAPAASLRDDVRPCLVDLTRAPPAPGGERSRAGIQGPTDFAGGR